ncbi:DUF4838 domain-containing protein [Jiangella rhizosphaerae]|uniref:DUF4838 domain-containing protein n=1 Tax=Jiangella rhizosphaerae TaxID=2293569 RepID=A0A418KGD1_9ACTN|nr:DUF4838 domain-containing protein [Jiangella rhizosphaerae]RIQ10827.1 DUF4838 domain-containing protein [Jiangella rhizosphaerae]
MTTPWFTTRGVVLTWDDITTYDWVALAAEAGLTTISVHTDALTSERGHAFLDACRRAGLEVEREQHALSRLLPRDLFETDPAMFRMTEDGRRVPDSNCCASSEAALEVIAANAVKELDDPGTTTGRYYFWPDDGGERCHCDGCAGLSHTDQALLVENRIVTALREVRADAQVSHLAYQSTMPAPVQVRPEAGVFLEFAPFFRTWEVPLSRRDAQGPDWPRDVPERGSRRAARRDDRRVAHGDYLDHLDANLACFGAETAQVLEYWLDVSLFSDWTLPAVELPWADGVLEDDLSTYGSRGIRRITTFAAYMNGGYFAAYPSTDPVRAYGAALLDWRP